MALFGHAGSASRCQFIEVKRISRLGAQVVRINADLLHFHSTPSASETSIGGVDFIGAKVPAQASVTNATMSNDRFIAVLPMSGGCRLAASFSKPLLDRAALLSGVGFSLSSRAGKMASSNETNRFVAAWPTKPLHKIATAVRDADWRDLDRPAPRQDWWRPSLGRVICHRHCHRRLNCEPN
jgi:hypothetical protein